VLILDRASVLSDAAGSADAGAVDILRSWYELFLAVLPVDGRAGAAEDASRVGRRLPRRKPPQNRSARLSLRSVNVAEYFDAIERGQLCNLLNELGPQAPTLLDPWRTYDLAAHLVLREHDSLAAPGLVIPGAWGRFAERRRVALRETGFTDLVATIRSGPPPGFFRIGWVRRVANLNEFFVHHEDVRRANGWGARTNPPAEDAALFRNVARAAWLLSRRLEGVGLELEWAGTDEVITARRGQPTARLRGLPGEVLLFLFGRREAADVEITGSPEAIETVRRTPFGM
jgi:uncharacterized protein (TIGR03085 family)